MSHIISIRGVIRYSYEGMSIYPLVWDPILYGGNLLWEGLSTHIYNIRDLLWVVPIK